MIIAKQPREETRQEEKSIREKNGNHQYRQQHDDVVTC